MKSRKKRNMILYSIVAALFVAPLIVFAVIYQSNKRENSFAPGNVDIEVHEGNGSGDEGEEVTKIYQWNAEFVDEKLVQIKDTRKNPGEVLRVSFVPMWFDKDDQGNMTDVFSGVFSVSNVTLSGSSLIFCDHNPDDGESTTNDKTITLHLADDWKEEGWNYSDPKADPPGDGFFYYTGSLNSSKLTAQLLESVELNNKASELTASSVFRLDVLADAIQKDHQNDVGNASPRW